MSHPYQRDIEAEPFLSSEKEAPVVHQRECRCFDNDSDDEESAHPKTHSTVPYRIYLIHLALITVYTLAYIITIYKHGHHFTLLNDTIRGLDLHVKTTDYVVAGASPFAGGPTAEVDGTWHQLLANITIRVSDDELSRNGDRTTSVRLPAGGGNMVWLGVFHQLHCLKKLRQLNYPQSYMPSLTEDERWEQEVHINHCIELLRQSVMCNPDTSLTTFSWSQSKTKPVLNIGGFERQCVDWEAFMAGVLPRVVSSQEVDALQNPNLVTSA